MLRGRKFEFGDATVVIDHSTTAHRHQSREVIFRIQRLGVDTCYRADLLLGEVKDMSDRHLAEFLLRVRRHRTRLFSYRTDAEV
jgi:hypothetical protein